MFQGTAHLMAFFPLPKGTVSVFFTLHKYIQVSGTYLPPQSLMTFYITMNKIYENTQMITRYLLRHSHGFSITFSGYDMCQGVSVAMFVKRQS